MALLITHLAASASYSTLTDLNFYIVPDGTSTTIEIELKSAPFNLKFEDNPPTAVLSTTYMQGATVLTATTTLDGTRLTITFASAPSGSNISSQITLAYPGLM